VTLEGRSVRVVTLAFLKAQVDVNEGRYGPRHRRLARPGGICGFWSEQVPFYNKVPVAMRMTNESKLALLRKGLLEFLVLKILGAESLYVPDILRRLAVTEFRTQEGTLYPLLSKLRREALVQYEWKESDAGPPRKYYQLTDTGRTQLSALDEYWSRINRTIATIGN
jgi:PadR family transcriptional regulator PadR